MDDEIPENRTPARDAQDVHIQLLMSLRIDGYSYEDVAKLTIADLTALLHDNVREPDGSPNLPTATSTGSHSQARLSPESLELLDKLMHDLFEVAPLAQHHALTNVMEGIAWKVHAEDMEGIGH